MSVQNTHNGPTAIAKAIKHCKSIFFVGIGGISMSALARFAQSEGFSVGGSDRGPSDLTQALIQNGAKIFFSHDAAHIEGYDAVVYTVAIDPENPEYLAAQKKGLPLWSRADYMSYVMASYKIRIGIAGMHGKTSCTAIAAEILLTAADPTVLCGARLPSIGNAPSRIGSAREHCVFEACEYMDSFLDFSPTLAVILNVGLDHVDYFESIEQIRASFLRYAERVAREGAVLYNADDAETLRALAPFTGTRVTFGIRSPADFEARRIQSGNGTVSFELFHHGSFLCRPTLHTVGLHSVYNALAAASAAYLAGVSPDKIEVGISRFTGAGRRMQCKGALPSGAIVYDDYAHHPDEIRATLSAARELGFSRTLCVYQPHTYSRTAGLLHDFAAAFDEADRVLLADIYAAREQNLYGVSSEQLAECIGEKAHYCGTLPAVATALLAEAREGDLVLVMGAGDVDRLFPMIF